MAEESTQPLGQQAQHDGSVTARTRLTSVDDKMRGSMIVPPTTVVPVIFVPGIMGSNLCDVTTGESVWNTNSTISILLQWIFRSASTRQSKLVPKSATVDTTGKWYGKSVTVPDEKAGKARGQGTTSRAFYGDFARWLDDHLNEHTNATAEGAPSPWDDMVDKGVGAWNPEKTPQVLTRGNADFAWDNFYCPVHVQGYNWLQSNGDSGKDLAKVIKDIIARWNGKSEQKGGPTFKCEKVILVSHSMGGLVTRAAVHPDFGAVADLVVGIVHGEQPANGAAAAYHHCRSGYGGVSGWVLGRNAAQVTAVFANSPGAMELLPNQQYPANWLKAKVGNDPTATLDLPETNDPYNDIYLEKERWWRLVDEKLIDPSRKIEDPWFSFNANTVSVSKFHRSLGKKYHPITYVHYGADSKKYPTFGDLIWHSGTGGGVSKAELCEAKPSDGSNPVSVLAGQKLRFSIVDPQDAGYLQPGDGTVPACSGEAPHVQGGGCIKQSFRLTGFDHQAAFDNDVVRQSTLYSICMLLQEAKVL